MKDKIDYKLFSTQALSKVADELVKKIAIASESDRTWMQMKELELNEVKAILLDRMNDENVHWLKEQMIRVEA